MTMTMTMIIKNHFSDLGRRMLLKLASQNAALVGQTGKQKVAVTGRAADCGSNSEQHVGAYGVSC